MARVTNYENLPYFPPPHYFPAPPNVLPPHNPPFAPKVAPPHPPFAAPPPPHHAPSPPSPTVKPPNHPASPPPPHPVSPPPPPPPPPHVVPFPPPPPHIIPSPPPPHRVPSPPHPISPPPPLSPPGHHSTVIIFVFVSIGGVFFLAFLAAALFCFIKKRKKRLVQETDTIKIEEHIRVQEAIVPGPHGTPTVELIIDEDVNIEEEIKKNEIKAKHSHVGSPKFHSQALAVAGSTSESNHHHHHG